MFYAKTYKSVNEELKEKKSGKVCQVKFYLRLLL